MPDSTIIAELVHDPAYRLASFRRGSVPSPGSPCKPVKGLKRDLPVKRVIRHQTGDVTVVTPTAWIRFWREPEYGRPG